MIWPKGYVIVKKISNVFLENSIHKNHSRLLEVMHPSFLHWVEPFQGQIQLTKPKAYDLEMRWIPDMLKTSPFWLETFWILCRPL